MKYKNIFHGIKTFIPGIHYVQKKHSTGGTNSARYCYSVWLRHLKMAEMNGLNTYPKVVAELGPGDSLGCGLAALLSGSEKYYAFDVIRYSSIEMNLNVYDNLIDLFQEREPMPGEDEFPRVKPYLNDYSFPHSILNEDRLNYSLRKERIKEIRDSIINLKYESSLIQYKVPWYDFDEKETVDMIFSQAVLEHISGLDNAYNAMYSWLKPNGYMSHEIDFKSHNTAKEWNGHWTYSDFIWRLIMGKRKYCINRMPYSSHVEHIKNKGFKIVFTKNTNTESKIKKDDLASRFKNNTKEDLTTSDAFIQAIKQKNDLL